MENLVTDFGRFAPTRAAGLARLAEFLPRAGRDYAEERNHVSPPAHVNVSGLSPWIRGRLISEEEVAAAAVERHGFAAAEKFVQEVYWRTYWKGWLEQRPGVWARYVEAAPRLRDGLKGERRAAHAAAREGRTGIDGFDTWARELVETGWLHNHARMWFASIWIHTLRLPWVLGAAFFYEHLLDGDPASNTLSWRWVAGLQTAGKTYLARADNIAKYTRGEHRPAEADLAAEPWILTEESTTLSSLEERDTDSVTQWVTRAGGRRAGVWGHADDLGEVAGEVAGFAGWPRGIARRAGWSARVEAWTRAALAGATPDGWAKPEVDDLAEALLEWAREERLEVVAAYEPAVGPWRDEARRIEAALGAAGVSIKWMRREWDHRWWPHARRGYFPFWEAVKRDAEITPRR
jgi:hypothetical protein